MVAIIKKLDESVINRIAAGEVIQRPCNAIKELIENSIDASSKNISIQIKEGGLSYIQIQDNGLGIYKEDLNLICERFTTSKLVNFEDLQNIITYGFRGEALASVSYVSKVTITTKKAEDDVGYKCSYIDGKPTCGIKPIASTNGTIITIEDLFYNIPIRKKALKSASEEYNKITNVVLKYAIHNYSIGFSLKKVDSHVSDIRCVHSASILEAVSTQFGKNLSNELIEFETENKEIDYTLKCLTSNGNYSVSTNKKFNFILFINNRLVNCLPFQKAVSGVYENILPKGAYPWTYVSLFVSPKNIDVNVHPTKSEVYFLYEEEIISKFQEILLEKLKSSQNSRAFYFPSEICNYLSPPTTTKNLSKINEKKLNNISLSSNTKINASPQYQVRNDSRTQKLSTLLAFSQSSGQNKKICLVDKIKNGSSSSFKPRTPSTSLENRSKFLKREIKLSSVKELISEAWKEQNSELTKVIKDHTFVGSATRKFALLQHDIDLYLINTTELSTQLFYQLAIKEFGNFGLIRFDEPLKISELAMIALNLESSGWNPEDGPKENLANSIQDFMISKRCMLLDYFSIEVSESGELCSLPVLLNSYVPCFVFLPIFILNFVIDVDWNDEKPCFQGICKELAKFYSFKELPLNGSGKEMIDQDVNDEKDNEECGNSLYSQCNEGGHSWKWTLEHIVYPAFKKYLVVGSGEKSEKAFKKVANLPQLYKIFERC